MISNPNSQIQHWQVGACSPTMQCLEIQIQLQIGSYPVQVTHFRIMQHFVTHVNNPSINSSVQEKSYSLNLSSYLEYLSDSIHSNVLYQNNSPLPQITLPSKGIALHLQFIKSTVFLNVTIMGVFVRPSNLSFQRMGCFVER